MANVIDYSDEYKWWDQTEAVTFTPQWGGSGDPISVDVARRAAPTRDYPSADQVVAESDSVDWHLPAALLVDASGDPVEPHSGDLIEDANGVQFVVNGVQIVTYGAIRQHYVCRSEQAR
jgi:hypothetical protein